jgi:hypothetical protein
VCLRLTGEFLKGTSHAHRSSRDSGTPFHNDP